MRAKIALMTALGALLLPGHAAAKEIESVQACGANGCEDVTALVTPAALDGGGRGSPPRDAPPFYRFKVVMKAGGERARWSFVYFPSAQKVRADDGTWMNPTTASLHALDRLVRGRQPLAAARPAPSPAAPPAPVSGGGVPAAAWVFGLAGAAALAACGLFLVTRRRGPKAA